METIKTRTGFGTPASPRYNAIGEPYKDKDSFFTRFVRNQLNPLGTTKEREDAVAKEIVRLGVGVKGFNKFMNLVEYPKYKKGKVSAFDRVNQLLSTVSLDGKTLRQALEAEFQLESYKNLGEPLNLGKGMLDEGGKVKRIKYIIEKYKTEALLQFEGEKKEFINVDNEKLNLKSAEKTQKNNRYEIDRDRTPNSKINIVPLYNFGNK